MIFEKKLADIEKKDLQSLIDNQIAEGKTIDYKRELPGKSDKDKKEFLADVSSFSNASGGIIVYGMDEDQGIPNEISGLGDIDSDSEILCFDNMLRDNIEPRIHGISIISVPVKNDDSALLIKIPRSWAKPHVVNYKGHWKFYSRNSAGKYSLDVAEVRNAFLFSETLTDRIRLFRTERIGRVISNEAPIPLSGGANIILHLVPLDSFDRENIDYDVNALLNQTGMLKPMSSDGWNPRINFDGLLSYRPVSGNEYSSYVQIFRNGIMEFVDEHILRPREINSYIPSNIFENEVITALMRSFDILRTLGVNSPVFIMLSLTGVSGYCMAVDGSMFAHQNPKIDRNELIVPEIYIENLECDPINIIRPAIDAVWNAAGWKGSMNYDEEGNWRVK